MLLSLILAAVSTTTPPGAICTIDGAGTVSVSENRLALDSTQGAAWTAPESAVIIAIGCDRDGRRVALALERGPRRSQVVILTPSAGSWSIERDVEAKVRIERLALDRNTLAASWSDRNGAGVSFLRWTEKTNWEPRSLSTSAVDIQCDPARRLWLVASGNEIRSYDYESFATRELFLFDDAIVGLSIAEQGGWFVLQFASHLALYQLGNPLDRGRLPVRGRHQLAASTGVLGALSPSADGFEIAVGKTSVRIAPEPLRVAAPAPPPKIDQPRPASPQEGVRRPAPVPQPEPVPTAPGAPPDTTVPTPRSAPTPVPTPAPPSKQSAPAPPPAAPPARAESTVCSAMPTAGQIAIEIEDQNRLAAEVVVLGPDSLLKEAWRRPLSSSEPLCVAVTGLAAGRYRVVVMGASGRSLATDPEYAAVVLTPETAPLVRFRVRGRR